MILTGDQVLEMLDTAKPLMEWLCKNCHPHCEVIVDGGSVRLAEDIARARCDDFFEHKEPE